MNKEICFWEKHLRDFPLIQTYEKEWRGMRDEILSFLIDGGEMYDYPQYRVPKKGTLLDYTDIYINSWKVIPISKYFREYFDTEKDDEFGEYCRKIVKLSKKNLPITNKIISEYEEIGVLRNAFVSKLDPGSIINPHKGRSNLYMRIHLGLDCDPECKITVENVTKTWRDGEVLAFKDGGRYPHGVIHKGTKQRIILSVDVEIDYLLQYVKKEYWDQLKN